MKKKIQIIAYIFLAIGVYNIMTYFGTAMIFSAGAMFLVANNAEV